MLPGSIVQRSFFDSFEFLDLVSYLFFIFVWVHKKAWNQRVHHTIQSAVHMTIIMRFPVTFNKIYG